jgi:hypothetical protein
MKRLILTTAMLMGLGVGGGALLAAETAPPAKAAPPPAHVHGNGSVPGPLGGGMGPGMGPMGGPGMGMMGGGMGGGGMGMGMMGGDFCPMGLGGPDTKVEVKNVDKGVTITFTSTDKARVARLQKMAEAMRLMHEATAP